MYILCKKRSKDLIKTHLTLTVLKLFKDMNNLQRNQSTKNELKQAQSQAAITTSQNNYDSLYTMFLVVPKISLSHYFCFQTNIHTDKKLGNLFNSLDFAVKFLMPNHTNDIDYRMYLMCG